MIEVQDSSSICEEILRGIKEYVLYTRFVQTMGIDIQKRVPLQVLNMYFIPHLRKALQKRPGNTLMIEQIESIFTIHANTIDMI